MASDPQTSLSDLLTTFKSEVIEAMGCSSQRFRQELRSLQGTLEKQFDHQFTAMEKNLSGPLSHTLPWDWIPGVTPDTSLEEFMETRRLRYRGDPSYVVSAKEYYAKYCSPQVDVLKELALQGDFYTPSTTSKLFAKFGRDVVDMKKRLFHSSEIVKSSVPQDQIEVAWAREATLGLEDIIEYVPQGTPVTRQEKEFFLDVANTVRKGLKYHPVPPLTEAETREIDRLKGELAVICNKMQELEQHRQRGEVIRRLEGWNTWELDLTQFQRKREDAERKARELEIEASEMRGFAEERNRTRKTIGDPMQME